MHIYYYEDDINLNMKRCETQMYSLEVMMCVTCNTTAERKAAFLLQLATLT